jgi:hypothetical protein
MDFRRIRKKGQLSDALEFFHICDLSRQKLQLNDTSKDRHKPPFYLIIKCKEFSTAHAHPTPQHYARFHITTQATYPLRNKH